MLAVAWSFYLLIISYLKVFQTRHLFYVLSTVSLLLGYVLEHTDYNYNPYILYFAGLFFAAAGKEHKVETLAASVFYVSVAAAYGYRFNVSQEILTAISALPLFYVALYQFKDRERLYSAAYLVCLILTNFISQTAFEILNILVPAYLTVDTVSRILRKKDEDLENFKIRLRKSIETEVQKEIERLEVKLQIAYKKLKEIFKLNSYTIREISIEEIAERVVKGLVDLGYTGAVLEIKKYSVLKKEGFFPGFKSYVEEIFQNIDSITNIESNKVVIIPLIAENEKLGTLAVYSKNELNTEEIEYLLTYTKSIATSITKIDYFNQIIKLRDLIYTAVNSIDIPLAVTNSQFDIEIVNAAFIEFVKMNNLVNISIVEIFPVISEYHTEISSTIQNKKHFHRIASAIENGKEKFYDIRAYPVISDSKIEATVFIIEDITEKIQIEKQMIQSEKLAVIGRLTSGISHEIKNPLAIISQSSFSLKRKIEKNCSGEIVHVMKELVERIEKSTARAKDIVDRLLNFSKPFYTSMSKVDIKDIIYEAIDISMLHTGQKNIKLKTDIQNAFLIGDRNSLIQLFINILINAIEAIDNSGEIEIKTQINQKDKLLEVYVKDTGHGIPQSIINNIFEPFFTTKEKGTGLGLSVCYRIVEDHGGKILVYSEEGKGSTFIIQLNLVEDENE